MKLQYTTCCALLMMVYLAGQNDRVVSSREIEEKIGFPQQCIFSAGRRLKKTEFINTVSGPFGGYILGKRPEEINVQQIMEVFKDSFSICSEEMFSKKKKISDSMNIPTKLLMKIEADINKKMASYTLLDLQKGTSHTSDMKKTAAAAI